MPPLLTNVSALPGEIWTQNIGSFQSYMSGKHHCFGLLYLWLLWTDFNTFGR